MMQRWEYTSRIYWFSASSLGDLPGGTIQLKNPETEREDLFDHMDSLGQVGWEAFHIESKGQFTNVFYKRPL
jgi:hypothetical protein